VKRPPAILFPLTLVGILGSFRGRLLLRRSGWSSTESRHGHPIDRLGAVDR